MSMGDLKKARKLFESVISKSKVLPDSKDLCKVALSSYNLGVLEIKDGYYDKALKEFENSLNVLKRVEMKNREVASLFIPYKIKGELKIKEKIENMDLQVIAKEAKKQLKLFLNKK